MPGVLKIVWKIEKIAKKAWKKPGKLFSKLRNLLFTLNILR